MKKATLPALLLLVLISCRPDVEVLDTPGPAQQWNRTELDALIWKTVRETGRFDWNTAPLEVAWRALEQSDGVLSVGYKPAGHTSDLSREIHQIDLNASDWQTARRQVLQLVFDEEKTSNPDLKMEQLEVFGENVLPVVNVRVTRRATLEKLRSAPWVRYAEPMGYEPSGSDAASRVASSSGCGEYVANPGLVPGVDFITIAPNAKVSWNHPYHRIGQAWTRTAGGGIKVMIIDTGVDPRQGNLGGNFNQGEFSQGRTLEKRVTLPRSTFLGIPTGPVETPDDPCGHGTAMAGVLAAPRAVNGNAVGVAYDCDLVTVRAAADVLLDESREVRGVSDAFVLAGNRSDIRVVSMSLGRITSSSQIADAVRFAFNRGKLIFCAAGTSFGWSAGWFGVIFPATMTEVSAVTGVKEDFRRCNNCHDGSQTDFVVVMEKVSNGLHPITTATSGDQPGTVGGSSVATAQTAGMAALVWSRFPGLSREEVLQRLVRSGSFFPNRNGNFGWGAVNADAATGEMQ
jgi:subtilisin family serine protease